MTLAVSVCDQNSLSIAEAVEDRWLIFMGGIIDGWARKLKSAGDSHRFKSQFLRNFSSFRQVTFQVNSSRELLDELICQPSFLCCTYLQKF
jgi:hypothetical protein